MQKTHEQMDALRAGGKSWLMESPPGPETVLSGRRYLYFAGTSYLGLQGHPELIAAAQAAVEQFGIHSATSRTGFGTSPPVVEVERRAAALLGMDEATYLASGYAPNFALMAAIASAVELVFIDEHAHDSLREAVRCCQGLVEPPVVFRHCDAGHLVELLQIHVRERRRALVLTDGVFPMSGHLPPLENYLGLLGPYDGSMLLVDDAHGLGVLGASGRGSLELAGVSSENVNRDPDEACAGPRVFHTATFSKAVGGHGGVIAGSNAFLSRVRRSSGWFRGAGAAAAPVAAATAKGLEIVATQPDLRRRLAENVAALRAGVAELGLEVESSPAPIIAIRLETPDRMQRVQQRLASQGMIVAYVRDYVGAGPDGLLRIAVFATHTGEMIERLLRSLGQVLSEERAA